MEQLSVFLYKILFPKFILIFIVHYYVCSSFVYAWRVLQGLVFVINLFFNAYVY